MRELLNQTQYILLGLLISGGIAGVVAGSRMLQSTLSAAYAGSVAMPDSVKLILYGGIAFGLSAGYLIRDFQADYWQVEE